MSNPSTTPDPLLPELLHLLSLAGIEMSILGDSTYQIGRTLKSVPDLAFAREHLPWKRGPKIIDDVEALSKHLARIAELMRLLDPPKPPQPVVAAAQEPVPVAVEPPKEPAETPAPDELKA